MRIFDDSFSIELKHPLDKESWKVITDAELDNTEHIYFTTPSGKRVDFIKVDVLDKIRTEIEELIEWHDCPVELDGGNDLYYCEACKLAIEIIDKYKIEGEE